MSSIQIISRQPRLDSSRRMRQFSFNSLKYFVIAPCRREYVDTFSSLYPPFLSLSLDLPAYIETLLLSPLSTRQICLICAVLFSVFLNESVDAVYNEIVLHTMRGSSFPFYPLLPCSVAKCGGS